MVTTPDRSRICVWVVTLSIALCTAADAEAPGAEAFGQVPTIAHLDLSPAGRLLAWSDEGGGERLVFVYDLEAGATKRGFRVPRDMTVRGLDWSDEETLLVHVSATHGVEPSGRDRYEWWRTLAADVTSGKAQMLLMSGGWRSWVTGATLLAPRTPKPKTVIMSSWDFSSMSYTQRTGSRLTGGRKDDGWVYNLFEVDTRTGTGKMIEQGTSFTSQWIVDASGQPVGRSEWEPQPRRYRVLARRGGSWKEIHRQQDGEELSIYGLSADGSALLAIGANGRPRWAAWSLPLDGSGAKILLEDPHADVESLVRDRYSRAVIGARIGGVEPRITWLDPKMSTRHQALKRTFAGRGVSIQGASQDGTRMLARVSSSSSPPIYYVVDFSKKTADIVGEEYPALVNAELGKVRVISYKARDGWPIPAYLTLPPGAPEGPLPLVVMPHGGPEARDHPGFDWAAQFFATRGYMVLQPQFRGSTGFGEAHRTAGYRQWGGRMQDDVTDGVKAMIEQGLADSRRICIAGMSYGGYAALAGAAFTPELYACAASINGVSDLPGMVAYDTRRAGEESDTSSYWIEHIGHPADPNVIAKSPVRAASNVRVPVLLIHGTDDTVVPLSQSKAMARALKKLGKPHVLVELPGEDHGLSQSETRVRVLKELEAFFAAHLAAAEN